MHLGRDWIARHIPHADRMCLLDEVLEWDAGHIRCRSGSHREPDNPLRAHGRLGAACGIEYAAQSIAVHAALIGGNLAGHGYLASVRSVSLFVERLDDLPSDLIASATRINSDAAMALYEFSLSGMQRILLSGRAAIVLRVNGS